MTHYDRRQFLVGASFLVASPAFGAMKSSTQDWWKDAIIYQIYPRSFQDSNGDGIGDLRGLTSRLDYVKSLGVDVIWLNPIFASPNVDNGYDISDYRAIHPDFGTMADFDHMLAEMKRRGLKVILDLVPNHCSDQHRWFLAAKTSRTNAYHHYFHWWNAERGTPPPREASFGDGNAWQFVPEVNAYYLHYFALQQPDLNWENPAVREEIYAIMRFWLDKGIAGFRMDVIPFISKDTSWPQKSPDYFKGPHLHEYLREMRDKVLRHYDVVTLGEGAGVNLNTAMDFVDPQREELDLIYIDGPDTGSLPDGFKVKDPRGIDVKIVRTYYDRLYEKLGDRGWATTLLGNHDTPRMVSFWASDAPEVRAAAAKMLTTFMFTMKGTPSYYFGDELGMSNVRFDRIEQYRDIESLAMYRQIQKAGGDLARFLDNQKDTARDNARTPFQWDSSETAGFTTGTPWLAVNPNHDTVNVAAEEKDPRSPLMFFRALVRLRRKERALRRGGYRSLDPNNDEVYSFLREGADKTFLIILNFKSHFAAVDLTGVDMKHARLALCTYPDTPDLKRLRPFEAAIYEVPKAPGSIQSGTR